MNLGILIIIFSLCIVTILFILGTIRKDSDSVLISLMLGIAVVVGTGIRGTIIDSENERLKKDHEIELCIKTGYKSELILNKHICILSE